MPTAAPAGLRLGIIFWSEWSAASLQLSCQLCFGAVAFNIYSWHQSTDTSLRWSGVQCLVKWYSSPVWTVLVMREGCPRVRWCGSLATGREESLEILQLVRPDCHIPVLTPFNNINTLTSLTPLNPFYILRSLDSVSDELGYICDLHLGVVMEFKYIQILRAPHYEYLYIIMCNIYYWVCRYIS